MNVVTKDAQSDGLIAANSDRTFSFTVPFETYKSKFADDHMSMRVDSVVTVDKSSKVFSDFAEFKMTNDENTVSIEFLEERGKVGEKMAARISFTNPLPVALTDLNITLEGPGLLAPLDTPIEGSVPAGRTASLKVKMIPYRAGYRKLLVDIDSKEQKDFKGESSIQIDPSNCYTKQTKPDKTKQTKPNMPTPDTKCKL